MRLPIRREVFVAIETDLGLGLEQQERLSRCVGLVAVQTFPFGVRIVDKGWLRGVQRLPVADTADLNHRPPKGFWIFNVQ